MPSEFERSYQERESLAFWTEGRLDAIRAGSGVRDIAYMPDAVDAQLAEIAQDCVSMYELWQECRDILPRLHLFMCTHGALDLDPSDRYLRRFACAMVRVIYPEAKIDVVDRYARGEATQEELANAETDLWVAHAKGWSPDRVERAMLQRERPGLMWLPIECGQGDDYWSARAVCENLLRNADEAWPAFEARFPIHVARLRPSKDDTARGRLSALLAELLVRYVGNPFRRTWIPYAVRKTGVRS